MAGFRGVLSTFQLGTSLNLRPANYSLGWFKQGENSFAARPVCSDPLQFSQFSFWHSLQNSLQEFLLVGDFPLNRPVSLLNFNHLIPHCILSNWHHHGNSKIRNRQQFLLCHISRIFHSESSFGSDEVFLLTYITFIMSCANMETSCVKEDLLVRNSLPRSLADAV